MSYSYCNGCGKVWPRKTQEDFSLFLKALKNECHSVKFGRDSFGFSMYFKTLHNCGGEVKYIYDEVEAKQ